MRENQRIAEGVATAIKAWGGEVLEFGDDRLLAALPSERSRDEFLGSWHGGVRSAAVIAEKAPEPGRVLFRWSPRRG